MQNDEQKVNEPSIATNNEDAFSDYSMKVKEVVIELDNYKYYHSPVSKSGEKDYKHFIGRRKILKRLRSLLMDSATESGAYLITGFRGMGKTSIVRKVIKNINQEQGDQKSSRCKAAENLINFRASYSNIGRYFGFLFFLLMIYFFLKLVDDVVTSLFVYLTQSDYAGFDYGGVLRFLEWLTRKYEYDLSEYWGQKIEAILQIRSLSLWLVLKLVKYWLLTSLLVFILDSIWFFGRTLMKIFVPNLYHQQEPHIHAFEINLTQEIVRDKEVLHQITLQIRDYWKTEVRTLYRRVDRRIHIIWFPIRYLFGATITDRPLSYPKILGQLDALVNRLMAEVTLENSKNREVKVNVQNIVASTLNSNRKNRVSFPVATTKEIESELIQILKGIDSIRKKIDEAKGTKGDKSISRVRRAFNKLRLFEPEYIPRFVFIIDELDKIEPNSSTAIMVRESSDPYFDSDKRTRDSFSNTKFRLRQEAIARLLANLKGFLNVARAKFIFIGGREMFDASLADIADRDSFYSSIFHDVIYINSFFKDKAEEYRSGVTRMTEAYLSKLLLPENYSNKLAQQNGNLDEEIHYSLKTFATYLTGLKQFTDEPSNNTPAHLRTMSLPNKLKIVKIINLLQNYIIYLTYRSNGSPKKLVALIERDIHSFKRSEYRGETEILAVVSQDGSDTQEVLGLKFNFNLQYEIGLTASIYRPYLITHSRINKLLGDKLLFSSAFIIDHILKFHPFGFSWRNLELIPEVILVNKEPNLRKFIEEVVRYLSSMHLRPAVSGLYQYRFFRRVQNELTLISKISELGAAAFNFTLDESIQIKRHYKYKLKELTSQLAVKQTEEFNHSKMLLQTILGDLHFYDKEYDDALLYYTQSVKILRSPQRPEPMTKHQFILWLRNEQKIALTLEKIRAYVSAYSIYRKIIIELPRILEGFEYDVPLLKKQSDAPEATSESLHADSNGIMKIRPYRSLQQVIQPFLGILALMEKEREDGLNISNIRRIEAEMEQLFNKIVYKYKSNFNNDVASENRFLNFRPFFLRADFFNSIGSILFYKNRPIEPILKFKYPKDSKFSYQQSVESDINPNYFTELDDVDVLDQKIQGKDYRHALTAYVYYKRSLINLLRPHTRNLYLEQLEHSANKLGIYSNLVRLLHSDYLPHVSSAKLYYIANVVSKLGDTILSSLTQQGVVDQKEDLITALETLSKYKQKVFDPKLKSYDELIEQWVSEGIQLDQKGQTVNQLLSLSNVMFFYRIASVYYLKASRTYSYGFQLKKVLYVLNDLLEYQVDAKGKAINGRNGQLKLKFFRADKAERISKIVDQITRQLIKIDSWTTNNANRPQLQKLRHNLSYKIHENDDRWVTYHSTTNATEVREILFLRENIRMFLFKVSIKDRSWKPRIECSLVSPYATVSDMHQRIIELKYRAKVYEQILLSIEGLEDLLFIRLENQSASDHNDDLRKKFLTAIDAIKPVEHELLAVYTSQPEVKAEINAKQGGMNFLAFIVREAIFCNTAMVKTINLFGLDYINTYSDLAEAHYRLGNWSNALENIHFLMSNSRREVNQKALKRLLGSDDIFYLEPNYHYENAIQNHYYAIQVHTEGRAYKDRVLQMYHLEDDYHDGNAHFSAALERLKINLGLTRSRIRYLSKIRDKSRLYQLSHYYPPKRNN